MSSEKIKTAEREEFDKFVHDIASPLLIINLAMEEVNEFIKLNGDEPTKKVTKMIDNNVTKLVNRINLYREKRLKES